MRQWKRLLGIFMSGVVLITGGILPQKNTVTAEDAINYGISSPRTENGVTTWDKIKFGSYYQDAEVQPAEPIKWRVLSVDENNNALLLADKILDCKQYNEECEDVTWESCTLRKWLNDDFYNEAFDDEEKKAVMETMVVNENNPYNDIEGGNDTKDKVYLLSIAEASNEKYGFDAEFIKPSETRKAKTTDCAKLNNVWSNSSGFGCWWLRSPGGYSSFAAYVYNDGYGSYSGNSVYDSECGVRPALHINLSSSKVTDAGEVDSEGKLTAPVSTDKIRVPRVKDGVTTWDCVYFGSYRQNCTFKKQDIEWRVLSVDENNNAFLLADKVLDGKQYNEKLEDVTWETCTLREWLNNDFYNEAFDDEEKKTIMETMVVNENNPDYDTDGDNDTTDNVYLLSIAEVSDAAYGFDTKYTKASKTRKAKYTDYAKINNVQDHDGFGSWWLRSPGSHGSNAASVIFGGYCSSGFGVSVVGFGVRPVLHINLSSSSWSKVGEISSVEQGDNKPISSPEPTEEPSAAEKPTVSPEPTKKPAEEAINYGVSNPRIKNGVTTWDKIKFGSYYQDAEVQPAEPIKWRVLSVDGDDAFLLADKNLDCMPYNEKMEDVTWETCTLRKWLNENFYNEAFDDEEKKAVRETIVVNEDNPYYGTEGGNNTKDKVYLLSIEEASDAAYGFDTEFGEDSKTREVKNTDYAKVNNVWSSPFYGRVGNGDWWLRSPGSYCNNASYVSFSGYGDIYGDDVEDNMYLSTDGVRPALHINLSSTKVKDAGEVDSEGNVTKLGDGISNPVVKDGVTTWDCVYFGNYIQNCTFKKQNIEWRVLAVDGDDAFLLADRILDAKPYNEGEEEVTWETCTLRKWLNEEFYNEAFNDEEKKAVRKKIAVNEDNSFYNTEGGKNTKDKVYLLSIAEASNAAYGFDTEFGSASETRNAKSSDYAKINNVQSTYNGSVSNGLWWLRSPGGDSGNAAYVGDGGYGDDCGNYVGCGEYGVRPVLHINLSSSLWSKASEVSSVEQGDNKPTASPEPTKEPTPTDNPATSAEPTKEPLLTDNPTSTPEATKEPTPTDKPISSMESEQSQTPMVTAQPTPPSVVTQNPLQTATPVLKQLKLSSVKCIKNTKKISGKVSVSKATIKIKVGKKAYKKAAVKGKKFTLKLNYKLKKKTKVIIKAKKKGYKSLVKSYTVK